MAGEFTNLEIKKAAIHKVFKREDKSIMIPPVFNNQCSELDSEAKRALVTRITKAFGNDSRSIKMDISDTGALAGNLCGNVRGCLFFYNRQDLWTHANGGYIINSPYQYV